MAAGLLPGHKKYIFTGDLLQQIVTTESTVSHNTEEIPSHYWFTYRFADTKPLLNIERTDTLPLILEIDIPDVGSFTTPPRLVEFPSLSLSEGALFPVQSPYAENWGTVSAGYLADYLFRLLGNGAEGTGGIGHVHDNIDLLQLLTYLEEYLLVGGKKIKAGYADETELAREFRTRNFINSMSAGKGGAIDTNGNAQLESLEVRSYLKVMELIYNRLNIQEGDYIFTEGGTIESVQQEDEDAYLLRIRKRHDDDIVPFSTDDIIYGIYHHTGGFFTSWMRVVNVNITANTILVVLGADSEVPAGKNYAPVAGMNLARRGNFTNPARQSSWYLSSQDGEIVFLDKVDNYATVPANRALVLGLPKNLPIPDNLPINPEQPYLYARGIIVQDIHRITYDGKIIRDSIDRGIWSPIVAASYEPYRYTDTVAHEVWHNSCKYQCIADKTLQEPRWNTTDWLLLAGNPEFTLEIVSSNGLDFDYGEVDTTLSIVARIHHTDVTADLLDSDIAWTRETGDILEDNAWNIAKADAGCSMHITTEDVGGYRFVNNGSCKFVYTTYLRDGGEVKEAKQEIPFG
ncbi:MAG: hypothetical protein LIP01_04930 [Tannerellaceae bacterium]|nr:hypothetical protein [Tannerellaceae bacterium]